MLLLPAIDLMDGQAVRLRQGKAEEKTVYSDDPAALARRWQDEGGDWLHLVDLDAAFSGLSGARNQAALRSVLAAVTIPCELGGGLRDEAAVRAALDLGVSRVVIGTRAAESMDFVARLVKTFGSEKVVVGIDARGGEVAVKGWTRIRRPPGQRPRPRSGSRQGGGHHLHRHRHRRDACRPQLRRTRLPARAP